MKASIGESIRQAIEYHLAHVHTCIPAKITAYDATTQKAQAKPMIKQKFYNKKTLSLPVITNVPVVFPHNKNSGLKFPLEAGDTVLLCFSEASMERWLSGDGGEVEQGFNRRFDLSDGIAIPCLYPLSAVDFGEAGDNDLILKHKDIEIILAENGTISISTKEGKFEIDAEGNVTVKCKKFEIEGEENLLGILTDLIDEIKAITVGGQPIDDPTPFIELKERLEKFI